MFDTVFLMPICPKDEERANWTIRSVRRHCRDFHILVLADGPHSSFADTIEEADDVSIRYFPRPSKRHWGRIWQMQNEGLMDALRLEGLSRDCIFVKIDSDAVVVRDGLTQRAQALFGGDPSVGQLGQCSRNISGKPLENKGWQSYFERRTGLVGLLKACCLIHRESGRLGEAFRQTKRLKELLDSARRNGYRNGEFAIGGSYILSRPAVEAMLQDGWLTDSPFRFFPTVGEDVMMTPHIYASGFVARDDVDPDGIFAICGEEPWIHPEELKRRGHYIIHPTKYGVTKFSERLTEQQIVERLTS